MAETYAALTKREQFLLDALAATAGYTTERMIAYLQRKARCGSTVALGEAIRAEAERF